MENNIPTARSIASGEAEAKRMIEFAKLHVEAALKEASENAELETYGNFGNSINRDSILTAYPLTNIK